MKVLIIRFSSIGDIVLTSPVARCIKEQVPNATIHYATKSNFRSILENDTYIDKLHFLENSLDNFIKELKEEKFDVIIDLHKNIRTLRIKLALGVKAYSYNKLNFKKWLLVNFKINKLPKVHIVDRYLETTKHLGVVNDNKGLHFNIPDIAKIQLSELDVPQKFICFAIGGQHETKKLPIYKIVQICNFQKLPIVLIGGKEDKKNGDQIVVGCLQNNVINLCGKLSINESAWLIESSEKIFTHDTGMMHIAAALKKEIVAFWGNTTPLFGMYPYLTKHRNIENKELKCRPCSKIGYNKCPKGHFKCMNELNITEIF
jgi:ADP-heptose:LPS heptosyltransferase